jgi:hypothetical protein
MLSMLSMRRLGLKCGPENWRFLLTQKCQPLAHGQQALPTQQFTKNRSCAEEGADSTSAYAQRCAVVD